MYGFCLSLLGTLWEKIMQLTDWGMTKEEKGELNLKRTGKSLWGHGMCVLLLNLMINLLPTKNNS